MIRNNKRFGVKEYDWDVFAGPPAGDPFVDGTLEDLRSGHAVKLSEYAGKWLVIGTGSSTCSMYTKNIPNMRSLAEKNADVEWVLVYVREANSGEPLHQHRSYEETKAAPVW